MCIQRKSTDTVLLKGQSPLLLTQMIISFDLIGTVSKTQAAATNSPAARLKYFSLFFYNLNPKLTFVTKQRNMNVAVTLTS